jgi:hypothetical protein
MRNLQACFNESRFSKEKHMNQETQNRRKETRYPIQAGAIIHTGGGKAIRAIATNISSFGMLLRIDQPSTLAMDEQVTVEIELPDDPDKPFSSWGVARVAHIDGAYFGIQLSAGTFESEP